MTGIVTKLNRIVTNRPILSIFSLFLLIQLILFYQIGIFTGLEAQKYIIQGNHLYETGKLSETKYIFYLPVIFLVYLCRLISVSYFLIVLVQVSLSGLSLFCFYKLSKTIGNNTVAFYSSLLLVLFIPLQSWNFYLYSDSIFISLTIIYTYIVCTHGSKGLKGTLIILLFLTLLFFCRPHGLLFIPPTIIYLLFRKQSKAILISSIVLCIILLSCMYLLLNMAFTGGEDMDAMKPFIEEHIICFVPMKPEGAALNIVKTSNPVNDIFYYIFHNPFHFLRLMVLKIFSFFNMTRSYYSTAHNVFLSLFLIPVYAFGITGLFRFIRPFRNFTIFLISLLILYPLGATFQCDDWHSRFTMVVFPYLILLSCIGGYFVFRKKPVNQL